jgi:hypothetical protein
MTHVTTRAKYWTFHGAFKRYGELRLSIQGICTDAGFGSLNLHTRSIAVCGAGATMQ